MDQRSISGARGNSGKKTLRGFLSRKAEHNKVKEMIQETFWGEGTGLNFWISKGGEGEWEFAGNRIDLCLTRCVEGELAD